MNKKLTKNKQIATLETVIVQEKILNIREQKVMLDSDLAKMYGIQTKVLIQAVKRNLLRFPEDFMFQLTEKEYGNLRSQIVTSSSNDMRSQFVTALHSRRNQRFLPYAFTEHGIAMLSSVLNSSRAIEVNIFIIRTFIKMREMFSIDQEFEIRVLDLECIQEEQSRDIKEILEYIRKLIDEPIKPPGPIGFQP
jgi:DNA polymerase IIIc chi subunit